MTPSYPLAAPSSASAPRATAGRVRYGRSGGMGRHCCRRRRRSAEGRTLPVDLDPANGRCRAQRCQPTAGSIRSARHTSTGGWRRPLDCAKRPPRWACSFDGPRDDQRRSPFRGPQVAITSITQLPIFIWIMLAIIFSVTVCRIMRSMYAKRVVHLRSSNQKESVCC